MNRLWLFLPLALAITLGMVLYFGLGQDPSKLDSALVGESVPDFQLPLLQTPEQQVGSEVFSGKVQLLNVWGTWCAACRVEHAQLNKLAEQGVPIVGLNYKDERPAALEWLEQRGNPYSTVIYDPEGSLGFDLGVYGAPETYLIDTEGVVRHRHVGVVDQEVWESDFKPLYEEYRDDS
ncbi:cytochrome c biogenesis protein CcmG/thiol:disulfide interchange protein DsbE [Halospina denitrificans]|uniref:Cytochrome c biogenesis protein CcmG/thiol:disulfide interchange protein DsbE n=1 Tax=Halospina denitrificans TaxID=332522 RepID=A0A4R7JNY7_9GAMM|nr:DsbE family thiol:disulfide interchange protein [Halospina denitrificans]TDT39286.1 cytochrome c biogenesis protein CcmG/thiol:disulfide interchange protein DsbE [Halospina denitrificans]